MIAMSLLIILFSNSSIVWTKEGDFGGGEFERVGYYNIIIDLFFFLC